jgi:death-on-curing protein
MTKPVWIDSTDAHSMHAAMIERFGGLDGVRDERLLESALARPQNLFVYEKPSLFDLAASYASGIVRNHPFLDGKKRTGFVAAALFLEANGLQFQAPEEEVVEYTLALAAGAIDEAAYGEWLERSCAG